MALELLSSEVTQAYGASTSISLTAPTREAGDGLTVNLWLESTTVTPSTPTGWTLLFSKASASHKVSVFGRIADATATDNFSSTFTSVGRLGGMRRIIGGPAAVTSWIVGTPAAGSSKVAKPSAVTTTAAETLLVDFFSTFGASTVETSTAGWTRDGTSALTLNKRLAAAGSSGEPEVAFTALQVWTSALVATPPKEEAPPAQSTLSMVI